MSTLKEVAKLAGVNASTVSRFLAGELKVKPEIEAAILRAVQEVNYQPNLVARSLRQGATHAVAVIVPNVHNPLFSEMTAGMIGIFETSSYFYFFFPSMSRADAEGAICQALIHQQFEGAIFTSRPQDGDPHEPHVGRLIDRGIKVVFANRAFGTSPMSEVFCDHSHGMYTATASLLAQGRRRIGLVLGNHRAHQDSVVRFRGYNQALYEHGLSADDHLIIAARFLFEEAMLKVPTLLDQNIDGLVCANDLMAAGALKCIAAAGARVPDDIAVVGYGDTQISQMVTPELSSVFQNSRGLGQRAAEILLDLLKGRQKGCLQECLPARLVVRASSASGPVRTAETVS